MSTTYARFVLLVTVMLIVCACQPILALPTPAATSSDAPAVDADALESEPQWPILLADSPDELLGNLYIDNEGLVVCGNQNGIAIDGEGDLLVVATEDHRIRRYNRNGQFLSEFGQEGHAPGEFNFERQGYPCSAGDIAVGPNGNIYVVDGGNQRIQKFDSRGNFLLAWGEDGLDEGQFSNPIGIAVDQQGQVFVADDMRGRVQIFDADGSYLHSFGGPESSDVRLSSPTYVATDAQNNVYITDSGLGVVYKLDADGQFVGKWGEAGSGEGELWIPMGITVDDKGTVYVTEFYDYCIRQFDSEGNHLSRWGEFGLQQGQLAYPYDIAMDAEGFIYVSDLGGARIQKFNLP